MPTARLLYTSTGADICRIEAAEAYNTDPYPDSDRVKKEAYEDLRPKVANLPEASLLSLIHI